MHHSFYRAITIHDTMQLQVSRNTIFDITGHAVYLESGVEEFNRIEYNLAAHIHVIEGPVMMGATHPPLPQSATIAVPADHTASGFYISNARKVAAMASHTHTNNPYSAAAAAAARLHHFITVHYTWTATRRFPLPFIPRKLLGLKKKSLSFFASPLTYSRIAPPYFVLLLAHPILRNRQLCHRQRRLRGLGRATVPYPPSARRPDAEVHARRCAQRPSGAACER